MWISTPPVSVHRWLLDKSWRVGITGNYRPPSPLILMTRRGMFVMLQTPSPRFPTRIALPARRGWMAGRTHPPDNAPTGHHRPFVWFRVHIELAPNHGPVSLLIQLPVSQSASVSVSNEGPAVDVYANGKEIHPEGPGGDDPSHYQLISRIYNLNVPADQTDLTLVMRTIYIPFGFGAYTSFSANRSLLPGHIRKT